MRRQLPKVLVFSIDVRKLFNDFRRIESQSI